MQGYGGRILFVDATTGSSRVEPVSEERARSLLGGNGFAARLLLDHVPAGIDAYDPANAVVFAVGPITDTTVPGNSRACVAAKSPLTGLFFDSTFGGRFARHAQAHRLRRRRHHRPRRRARLRRASTEAGAALKPARGAVGADDARHGARADPGGRGRATPT